MTTESKDNVIKLTDRFKNNYNARPFKEWDEKTPLYSEVHDQYFYDTDSIAEFISETNFLFSEVKITSDDLMLVICDPQKPRQVDTYYWEDIYPEYMDFEQCASNRVKKALKELNEALAEENGWSWVPGQFRTSVKIEQEEYDD